MTPFIVKKIVTSAVFYKIESENPELALSTCKASDGKDASGNALPIVDANVTEQWFVAPEKPAATGAALSNGGVGGVRIPLAALAGAR